MISHQMPTQKESYEKNMENSHRHHRHRSRSRFIKSVPPPPRIKKKKMPDAKTPFFPQHLLTKACGPMSIVIRKEFEPMLKAKPKVVEMKKPYLR